MLKQVETGNLQVVSEDPRRTITEFNFSESAFNDFFVKDDPRPLGQHFHKSKSEVFYFIEGTGTIRTAEVDASGKIIGEIKRFTVTPGFVITIPPMHTHRFDVKYGTHFVSFSSKPFDKNDTVPCPIE